MAITSINLCDSAKYWIARNNRLQRLNRLPLANENIELTYPSSVSIDLSSLSSCNLNSVASVNVRFASSAGVVSPPTLIAKSTVSVVPSEPDQAQTIIPILTIGNIESNGIVQIEKCQLYNDQISAPKVQLSSAALVGSLIVCSGIEGTGILLDGAADVSSIINHNIGFSGCSLNTQSYIQNSGYLLDTVLESPSVTFNGGSTKNSDIFCDQLTIQSGGPHNSTTSATLSVVINTGVFGPKFQLNTPKLTVQNALQLSGKISVVNLSGSHSITLTTPGSENDDNASSTLEVASGYIPTLNIEMSKAVFETLQSNNINNSGDCQIQHLTPSTALGVDITNYGILYVGFQGPQAFQLKQLDNISGSTTISANLIRTRNQPISNSGFLSLLGEFSGTLYNYSQAYLAGQDVVLLSTSTNSGTIKADIVTLQDTANNTNNITASLISFRGSSVNAASGVLQADTISFYDGATNYASGVLYSFYNQSQNSGNLIAANFYDNASNASSVSTAHFYATSTNAYSGTLDPTYNWTFHDTSTNDGSLVRSNSIPNKMSRYAVFSAKSQNRNTVWGAKFIDSAKNIGTFVNDCDFYNTSVHNASSGTNLYFYDSSISSGNISASGHFFHRSSNKGSGNSLFFYDSSLNEGSANIAMFAGQSMNRGISTNAIYSGTINRGECMISGSWLAAGANRGACSRGTFTFDQSHNLGTISDSTGVKFIQPNARNTGPIQNSTDCLFASGATNRGTLNNCSGVIFQQSVNRGTLLNCTNLSFTNNSMNYGVISGSVSPIAFSNNSINYGTIAGSATFDNTSTNLGTIIPVSL